MMAEHSVVDLLKHAHENEPNDFKDAFQSVMQDKLGAAIDARREDYCTADDEWCRRGRLGFRC